MPGADQKKSNVVFDRETYVKMLITIARADKQNGPPEYRYIRRQAIGLGVNYEKVLKETDRLFEIGSQQVSRLTALRVLKDAIMIASMDGNFTLPEKQKVYTYAEKLDIPRTDVDRLENPRRRTQRPGPTLEGTGCRPSPMNSTGFVTPLFEYADRAVVWCSAGFQWLDGLWRFLSSLDPWFSLGLFLVCSMLMVYRLNVLERKGLEGTVLGTLIMPYASGFPNLMFAFSLGRQGGSGSVIVENCIVNNVTNLTLLIGLPALVWTLNIIPSRSTQTGHRPASKLHRLNTLSLMLTLVALFFFTGALWALGRDGVLDFGDGLVLVGIFLFWQVLHVFDVLKYNIHQRRSLPWTVILDAIVVVALGAGVLNGIDRLVVLGHGAGSWICAL